MGYLTTDGLHQFPFPTSQGSADALLAAINDRKSSLPVAHMAHASTLQVTGPAPSAKTKPAAAGAGAPGKQGKEQQQQEPPGEQRAWWRHRQLLLACFGLLLLVLSQVMTPYLVPSDAPTRTLAANLS